MNRTEQLRSLTEQIAGLVALPGDPGQEAARLEVCQEWLAGHEVEWHQVPGFGGNLLAYSQGRGPRVVLAAHLDTVAPAPGWEAPREPKVVGGPAGEGPRLIGLGAADMLAGVAVAVEAFKTAAGAGRNCTLLLACDEEGYSRGVNAALEAGLEGDIALVAEPSGERMVLGARGRLVLEVAVEGQSAHAARPGLGISAAAAVAELVGPLEGLACPAGPPLDPGGYVVLELRAKARGLSLPVEARLVVDRHTVAGETPERVIEAVEKLAGEVLPKGAQARVGLKERPTPAPEPYVVDPAEPLVARFADLLPPERRKPGYGRSVGDYNFLASRMPTVVYGPRGGQWHAPGEWVELASAARVLSTYQRYLLG